MASYAYANWFRPRPAYRFCVENSVCVHSEQQRNGTARLLMTELMSRCEVVGAPQMVAVIGDCANAGSVRLHLALCLRYIGTLQSSGWIFDRWLYMVVLLRYLPQTEAPQPRMTYNHALMRTDPSPCSGSN